MEILCLQVYEKTNDEKKSYAQFRIIWLLYIYIYIGEKKDNFFLIIITLLVLLFFLFILFNIFSYRVKTHKFVIMDFEFSPIDRYNQVLIPGAISNSLDRYKITKLEGRQTKMSDQ